MARASFLRVLQSSCGGHVRRMRERGHVGHVCASKKRVLAINSVYVYDAFCSCFIVKTFLFVALRTTFHLKRRTVCVFSFFANGTCFIVKCMLQGPLPEPVLWETTYQSASKKVPLEALGARLGIFLRQNKCMFYGCAIWQLVYSENASCTAPQDPFSQ